VTPGRDDDPRDSGERPKKSWREIDAARDRSRARGSAERRPAGAAVEARASAASKRYLRELEGALFSKKKGGAAGERLARTVREAHATPGLAEACRAYREALGIPEDPGLVALFLDSQDAELLVAVLEALAERAAGGRLTVSSGLRTQLRLLARSPDDAVAERAEELLDRV